MNDKICKNCKRHFIEEIAFDYPQSCCHISEGHGKTTEPFLTCNEFEYNSEYLEKKVNQLQSNWNSLREWLEDYLQKNEKWFKQELSGHDKEYYKETYNVAGYILDKMLDKMNELESGDSK